MKLIESVQIGLIAEKKNLENTLENLINNPISFETQTADCIEILKKIGIIDYALISWQNYVPSKNTQNGSPTENK